MLKNYIKIAIRNLSRNKVYSIINITGLSLGLACAMLIILYTKDEVSYDRFHRNVANIYRVVTKQVNPDGSLAGMGGPTGYFPGPRFKANIPEIESFVRMQSNRKDYKMGTDVLSMDMHFVDSNFFEVFSLPFLRGDARTALLQPNSVVISEDFARKQFGTIDAMGKTILFKEEDKFEPRLVTGILKRCPQNSSIKINVAMPIVVEKGEEEKKDNWFNFFLNTFVVLHPNADIKLVEQKMKRVYEGDAKEAIQEAAEKYGMKFSIVHMLQPMTAMHLSKDYPADNGLTDNSNPIYSYILSAIAIFILVIASINFVNLTVARSIKRSKEIGIRKVVGGERKQLIIQFLGESYMLCLLAFVMALAIVELSLPTFNFLANKSLSLSYLFDLKLVTGYIGLFLLTGLLAGFYPALVLSNFNPVQTLYNRFHLSGKNYLQKSLVVLQFALATLLIIATITIYSQFNFLTTAKLGYDDSNLLSIEKWGLKTEELNRFREEIRKFPGVIYVAPKNRGRWGTIAKVNGDTQIEFSYETVDASYLPMLHVPIIKGRNFSEQFPSDSTHSVLVNETFVKKAGWKEPIGQEVNFWYRDNEKYTVVGVVKDYHFASLGEKISPQLFTMKPGNGYGMIFIKLRPDGLSAGLHNIEATFKKLFPLNPYSYKFQDEENRANYESEAKWKQMMLFGALLTIFISSIGLFGLSVLAAERRTKEIGIRKVLGATVTAMVTILSKDFLKLVILSMVIAMPMAWLLVNKWLENYPYRINMQWWMFAGAGLLIAGVALLTVGFQAFKSAIANPVKSLRTE